METKIFSVSSKEKILEVLMDMAKIDYYRPVIQGVASTLKSRLLQELERKAEAKREEVEKALNDVLEYQDFLCKQFGDGASFVPNEVPDEERRVWVEKSLRWNKLATEERKLWREQDKFIKTFYGVDG